MTLRNPACRKQLLEYGAPHHWSLAPQAILVSQSYVPIRDEMAAISLSAQAIRTLTVAYRLMATCRPPTRKDRPPTRKEGTDGRFLSACLFPSVCLASTYVEDPVSEATACVVSCSKAAARIRAAAIEAFAEKGYNGTTTRDIAARLGLSAAAMYPHYKSKEELLYAIAYEGHRKTVAWLQEADPVTESPADRLRAVIGEFARTHAQYHARARVVEYELAALAPDHYRVIVGLRRELTRHVRRIVEAGSADGSFVVPDSEGVTLAIISLCVDVCRWFPAGRYTDPDKVAKLYSELAVRLVGADERVGTD